MVTRRLVLLSLGSLLWLNQQGLHAQTQTEPPLDPYAIVVHPDNRLSHISDSAARKIYMGQQTLWANGKTISPATAPRDSHSVRLFLKSVVHRTPRQFNAYWKKRLFSGGGTPPRIFNSHEVAVRFVSDHPEAIAVVKPDAVTDQVKALRIER